MTHVPSGPIGCAGAGHFAWQKWGGNFKQGEIFFAPRCMPDLTSGFWPVHYRNYAFSAPKTRELPSHEVGPSDGPSDVGVVAFLVCSRQQSWLILLPASGVPIHCSHQRFFFGHPPLGGDHQFQIVNLNFISLPLDGTLTKRNMIIYGCEIPT